MRVVFVTNYFNHHQSALSEALYRFTNGNFYFIETGEMSEERIKLGWSRGIVPSYVINSLNGTEQNLISQLIENADVVIIGDAPRHYFTERLKTDKLTFRYSERIYKNEVLFHELPFRAIKHYIDYGRHANLFLLCASAYASADYARTRTFTNRAYKWGYFSELREYKSIHNLIQSKKPASILWVGRFIDWKHPEAPLQVAKRLKKEGIEFSLNMIGSGDMEAVIKRKIEENNLADKVELLGSMSPDRVRNIMEESQIVLFTSDFKEGWGVVLNEAMNSGCAVIASHAIGAVPFLLKNGENGLIYENGNEDSLYKKVKELLKKPEYCRKLGHAAYDTMINTWNAEAAASRFLRFADEINKYGKCDLFKDGPCSRASLISNGWFSENV